MSVMPNLYNYALLSGLKEVSGGKLSQVFCLFAKPIISEMGQGNVFKPLIFLQHFKKKYGIDWNENIIKGYIRQLEQSKLIKKQKIGNDDIYICDVPKLDNETNKINIKIKALLSDLRDFLADNPCLSFFNSTDDELLDKLAQYLSVNDWLDDNIPQNVNCNPKDYNNETDYVFARFISSTKRAETLSFLSELSGNIKLGALLKDFSVPNSPKKSFSGQNIFLDNTLLLSYLGLCGTSEEKNARYLINLLKDNGAKILVYSHTCEEAINALQGVLNHQESERFGLTWAAIINHELPEEQVDFTIRNFYELLSKYDIEIIETASQIDNTNFSDIFSELNFLKDRPTTRERDALSIFYMLHKQTIERKSDILQLKNIFITTNPKLVSAVKRYMISGENTGYNPTSFASPFIVLSKMDFLLWLIYGNEDKNAANIPTIQLICNADKVRRLKPEIFKIAQFKVKMFSNLEGDKLDAMLQEPRYKQVLADVTMNDIKNATDISAEQIIQAMENENKKEIRSITARYKKEISSKDNELSIAKKLLQDKEDEEINRVQRIMTNTINANKRLWKYIDNSVYIIILLSSAILAAWSNKLRIHSIIIFLITFLSAFFKRTWIQEKCQHIGIRKKIIKSIDNAGLKNVFKELNKNDRINWSNYTVKEKNSLLPIQQKN